MLAETMVTLCRQSQALGGAVQHMARVQEEDKTPTPGTLSAFTREVEINGLLARGCNTLNVKFGAGELGKPLFRTLKNMGEHDKPYLVKEGFPVLPSNKICYTLAGGFWGGTGGTAIIPNHRVTSADFTVATEATWDDFVSPSDNKLEAKQGQCHTLQIWERRSKAGAKLFSGTYGSIYFAERIKAIDT